MSNEDALVLFQAEMLNEQELFERLFSSAALQEIFEEEFSKSSTKGTDRLNAFQFAPRATVELTAASARCMSGKYRFAPYLEVLKVKGRNKPPRLIGIPTIRDRVVLHQLNAFLAAVFPERVPRSVAGFYVRTIAEDIRNRDTSALWVCSTDIQTFYDSIDRGRLVKTLQSKMMVGAAVRILGHALQSPTVPKNTRRQKHSEFRSPDGVTQGLAISNILASIYMMDVDDAIKKYSNISYYRYVDDILLYGSREVVETAFKSLSSRLRLRKLRVHAVNSISGKTRIAPIADGFSYLGYTFEDKKISVRSATVERFLQSVAAKFSEFKHNKTRRLEQCKYLNEERLAEIFLDELNERITGAISQKKRYGWIAYYSQITDLSLLHRLDSAIAKLFSRLPEFDRKPPQGLKKLSRAIYEMQFRPRGGYVRDYDKILTRVQKLEFLRFRGRLAPDEQLTDAQIEERYTKYVHRILAAMHADEGTAY